MNVLEYVTILSSSFNFDHCWKIADFVTYSEVVDKSASDGMPLECKDSDIVATETNNNYSSAVEFLSNFIEQLLLFN